MHAGNNRSTSKLLPCQCCLPLWEDIVEVVTFFPQDHVQQRIDEHIVDVAVPRIRVEMVEVFKGVVVPPIMEEIAAEVHQDRRRVSRIPEVITCVGDVDGETDRKDASSEIEEVGGGDGETDRMTEGLVIVTQSCSAGTGQCSVPRSFAVLCAVLTLQDKVLAVSNEIQEETFGREDEFLTEENELAMQLDECSMTIDAWIWGQLSEHSKKQRMRWKGSIRVSLSLTL